MPRKVRRVPPNWEHPRWTTEEIRRGAHLPGSANAGDYRPCYDYDYETASRAWVEAFNEFEADPNHPNRMDGICKFYWEYDGHPDVETCRPAFTEPATWWQFYEETSEGTPISPAFATAEQLARHIWEDSGAEYGANVYQRDGQGRESHRYIPPSQQTSFDELLEDVRRGWA